MDINRTNMQALYTSYSKAFLDAYVGSVDTKHTQFSMVLRGSGNRIDLPLLAQISGMREWIGPREIKNLSSDKLSITARDFEDTVGVNRNDVEDDAFGLYLPAMQMMAVNAANMSPDVVNDLLTKAATATWLDGAAFFGTARKYGKNTIANKGTGALTYDTFNAAFDAMRAYKGHGGQSLKVQPNILLHGPALRLAVADLIDAPFRAVTVGDAAVTLTNPNAKKVTPIELDGITGNDWFLLDARLPYKPLAVFMRKEANKLVRMDRDEDENVFFNKQFIYGTDGRAEAAFVLPHLIYYADVA